ncbi:MAG: rod-binding protein [Acidobacteria bacterium]|nr:rod-binding protein [Acidobacteriota bacterium]
MDVSGIGAAQRIADGAPARRTDSPEKIKDAAVQFEALLIGQLMKSMRESSSGGWMGESGDASSASMLELADEQFSRAIAARGGLGIARMVAQGLEPHATPAALSVKGSSSE